MAKAGGTGDNKGARPGGGERSSRLAAHRRIGKRLIPPLLQLPTAPKDWFRDVLPQLLWIASVKLESGVGGLYDACDVLDRFVPADDSRIFDGRLVRFSLFPTAVRPKIRAALREEAPQGIPDELGHALSLYPECPGYWLYEDWRQTTGVDEDIGVAYVRLLLERHIDSRSVESSRLRMPVMGRYMKHGKLSVPRDAPDFQLLPGYPDDLTEAERRIVESIVRASFLALMSAMSHHEAETADGDQVGVTDADDLAWPNHFWGQNWRLSECELSGSDPTPSPSDQSGGEAEGESDPTPGDSDAGSVLALRDRLMGALTTLGEELRRLQASADIDLFDPVPYEVLLGIASRQSGCLGCSCAIPCYGPTMLRLMSCARSPRGASRRHGFSSRTTRACTQNSSLTEWESGSSSNCS